MADVQTWLEQKYPKDQRKFVTDLTISSSSSSSSSFFSSLIKRFSFDTMEGFLNLQAFENLDYLECRKNNVSGLDLSNCPKLREINCEAAGIKEFDFSNNPNLETINIKGNGVEADLSIFSNLPKLRRLEIGINATWSIGTSNNFSGSLASLKNCENLEYLDISYQNEITGNLLEDLIVPMPKLTEFYCAGTEFDELLRPSGYNTNDLRLLYQQSIDKKLQLERERQKEKQNHFKKILLYSFGLFLLVCLIVSLLVHFSKKKKKKKKNRTHTTSSDSKII